MKMQVRTIYQRILSNFPQNMRLVFAYGSGVFQQTGHQDMSKNMLDFVITVDDPIEWHRENMAKNYKHYSFLKYFGPRYVTRIQDKYGAGVYFNTLVPCEGRLIKYGVISTSTLIRDLFDWDTLYMSGRLHKPVKVLMHEEHPDLSASLATNRQSAVHAALLLLSDSFTEEELYCMITSLSYTGDFRMTVGEDRNKISNIVKPNIEQFREIYEKILESSQQHLYWDKSSGIIQQDLSPSSLSHHLNLLPKMLLVGLVACKNKDGRFRDTEEVIHSLSHDSEYADLLHTCIAGIVKQSSWSQSVKSVFTAGFSKSIKYSCKKMKKMFKSGR